MSDEDSQRDTATLKRKPKRKARSKGKQLSREQVAELLAEVALHAPHETPADICKRYGISEKTLQRWKKRAGADKELSAAVLQNKRVVAEGLRDTRIKFLRNSIEKLGQLVQASGVENMRDVSGAIKIVGDLNAVSHALGIDDEQQPVANRQGPIPPEAEGADGGAPAASDPSGTPVH